MNPNIKEMAQGYITAALWADCQPLCDCAREEDDQDHSDSCTSNESGELQHLSVSDSDRSRIEALCQLFTYRAGYDLLVFAELRSFDPAEGSVWEHIGHDLRLTSGGHGTGFWDREPVGMRDPNPELSEAIARFMTVRGSLAIIAKSKPFDNSGGGDCWQVDENTAMFDIGDLA